MLFVGQIIKRNTLASVFKKGNTKNKDGMLASYNISKFIAKYVKPYSIGEMLIFISTAMNQNDAEIIFFIHWVIHNQPFLAKKLSDQINSSLKVVIIAINSFKHDH